MTGKVFPIGILGLITLIVFTFGIVAGLLAAILRF
jgi:hypothetical protein